MPEAPVLEYETPLKSVPNRLARWSLILSVVSIGWCYGVICVLIGLIDKADPSPVELLSFWGSVFLMPFLSIIFGVLGVVQIRRSRCEDRRGTALAIAGVAVGSGLILFVMCL